METGGRVATLRKSSVLFPIAAVTLIGALTGSAAWGHPDHPEKTKSAPITTYAQDHQMAFRAARGQGQSRARALGATACVNGHAGTYPCRNIDLAAFVPISQIGGGSANDIWGWTDPVTDREYALMGRSNGTSFVDVTVPESPVYLGTLPPHTVNSDWRDLEVFGNTVVIVSEAAGHGMQVFDLTRLRTVTNPPVTFTEDAHYDGFGSAHTVTVSTATGFVYANGSKTCGGGGAHIVDLRDPDNPTFAGCYSGDGYTHDSQCVIYHGPDVAHQGQEICFESNEDTITIVNMTNKSSPQQISRTGYPGVGYTHQGWLTPDHGFFLLDDELDEVQFGHNTWTRVFGMRDLERPVLRYTYKATTAAVDHQMFINGSYIYQSNYRAGVRILNRTGEVAFFDLYPANDQPGFNGTWANYPFFDSGTVVASHIEEGLFILKPNLPASPPRLSW
jgi:choice-of-anchor B domain-containing protein